MTTSKRSSKKAAAEPEAKPVPNDVMPELFAARNKPAPKELPEAKEPPIDLYIPAVGPNVDGLVHQALLSHAADDDERALIAADLDARIPAPDGAEG